MKKLFKLFLFSLIALLTSITTTFATEKVSVVKEKPTAKMVYQTLKADSTILSETLIRERCKDLLHLIKLATKDAKSEKLQGRKAGVGLYILAVLCPPVAVGIYTDWKMPTVYNTLFTICGWLPGNVHAFYILTK